MPNEIKSHTYTSYSKTRFTVSTGGTRPLILLYSMTKSKQCLPERDTVHPAAVMGLIQKLQMKLISLCYWGSQIRQLQTEKAGQKHSPCTVEIDISCLFLHILMNWGKWQKLHREKIDKLHALWFVTKDYLHMVTFYSLSSPHIIPLLRDAEERYFHPERKQCQQFSHISKEWYRVTHSRIHQAHGN